MAWNAARPVPWPRLVRQSIIYLLVFNAAMLILARDDYGVGVVLGSIIGAAAYLGLSWVMVKFGWNPPGGFRAQRAAARQRAAERAAPPPRPVAGARPKPPPTKRTSGGAGPRRR